jgi:hypothetical protein
MGKRELILVVAFLAVGVVIYQVTAPPPGPNERSFSFSRIVEGIRREVRGNRAVAEQTNVQTYPADAELTEVRLGGTFQAIEITGEDRADVESSIRVESRGYDDAEAKKTAAESILKADRAGSTLALRMNYPDPGEQRAWLKLKVPTRLKLRVESGAGRLVVSNVAAADFTGVRGETTIKRVAGRVAITHRAGQLVIEDVGSLKLSGRATDATVTRVRGEAALTMEGGGELSATDLAGPIEADARSAELTFNNLEKTKGPIRINSVGGAITLKGLSSDARVDARNAEVEVTMAAAAPVAIYCEGGAELDFQVPPGGFRLDAVATNGRITPPELLKKLDIELSTDEGEQRATGAVRGGGPTVTLRSNRGEIMIRER